MRYEGHSQAVLYHIGEGVLKLDTAGKVVYANPAALKLAGEGELNVIGRSVCDLFGFEVEPDFKKALREVMRSKETSKRTVAVVRGETILRVALTNVIEEGEPAGAIVILQDASKERLAQTDKLRAMGVMASGVAHDFNNMLAVILGTAELLLSRVKNPWIDERLEVIRKAALDGAETVRRIQEFSRSRSDDAKFVPVDINQVVRDAIEFTKPRWRDEAEHSGVVIRLATDLQPVAAVLGNPSELREVLVNVLLNAIEAMPQGGEIVVSSLMRDRYVIVTVRDSGCGISDEVKARVFDPFFTTKGTERSGLGLSVSHGIVTRHKGEISLEGELGKGARVEIKFPTAGVAGDTKKDEELRPVTKQACILLIENNDLVRNALIEGLELGGHAVTGFGSARDAMAAFEPDRYDVVFTDLGMLGMSGWEVARAVKARAPAMPVVLVTGWGATITEEEARSSGVDIVMSKPFEYGRLMSVVEKALRMREAGWAR